jgi:hypothetical protein
LFALLDTKRVQEAGTSTRLLKQFALNHCSMPLYFDDHSQGWFLESGSRIARVELEKQGFYLPF